MSKVTTQQLEDKRALLQSSSQIIGADPGQLTGLLILAGNDHMSAAVFGNNGTLQHVLGIPQARVYDFSEWDARRSPSVDAEYQGTDAALSAELAGT